MTIHKTTTMSTLLTLKILALILSLRFQSSIMCISNWKIVRKTNLSEMLIRMDFSGHFSRFIPLEKGSEWVYFRAYLEPCDNPQWVHEPCPSWVRVEGLLSRAMRGRGFISPTCQFYRKIRFFPDFLRSDSKKIDNNVERRRSNEINIPNFTNLFAAVANYCF